MNDEIPVPAPRRARHLPCGGWIATRSPVIWEGEKASGCCGAVLYIDPPVVCSRGYHHESRWHIAGLNDRAAVAVWQG